MDTQRVRILLVEDDSDDVWLLRNLLGDRWDGPFEIIHVDRLAEAIAVGAQGRIDVILLDLSLPDCCGLETFLRMYAKAGEVPIVVLTGLDDETAAIKAVQAGAQDYLVKGQVDDHLLVRSIRYAIERTRRYRAERQLQATSEEFRIAQEIQRRLFPVKAPVLEGFDIAGAVYPAKATAGDYFDYVPLAHGDLAIVVADVSSHGMGPALVMAETRACLRALAQVYDDVGEILTRANRVLVKESDEFHFVTLAMARLGARQRELTYASAGQRGYLLDPTGQVTVLDSTSEPLGVRRETVVPAAPPIPLEPGQIVTLFTDGVAEAESPGHTRFGFRRALDVVLDNQHLPAADIVAQLHQAVEQFCRQPQADDITAVIVKVLG